jgi:hypothetical protein
MLSSKAGIAGVALVAIALGAPVYAQTQDTQSRPGVADPATPRVGTTPGGAGDMSGTRSPGAAGTTDATRGTAGGTQSMTTPRGTADGGGTADATRGVGGDTQGMRAPRQARN